MNVNRVLEVRNGDAVRSVRDFLGAWWEHYHPDALLAPVEGAGVRGIAMKLIEDPGELSQVNPFTPLMSGNSASQGFRLSQEHPGGHMAVLLRPCELRALVELRKRQRRGSRPNNTVVIAVDCLGTYSQTDYEQMVDRRGMEAVTDAALVNATEGGLRPQGYRTACQICDWPAPRGADLAIGTIGINSKRALLLIARDEKTDAALGLDGVARELASEYEVSHREMMVGAIADVHTGMRKAMIEDMQDVRFDDLGSILAWFASCSLCGECLKACPLYDEEFSGLIKRRSATAAAHTPLRDMVSLSRWLASCAGCGMCEEECNMNVPLFLLISALSHRIREKIAYRSGDPAQKLPWVPA